MPEKLFEEYYKKNEREEIRLETLRRMKTIRLNLEEEIKTTNGDRTKYVNALFALITKYVTSYDGDVLQYILQKKIDPLFTNVSRIPTDIESINEKRSVLTEKIRKLGFKDRADLETQKEIITKAREALEKEIDFIRERIPDINASNGMWLGPIQAFNHKHPKNVITPSAPDYGHPKKKGLDLLFNLCIGPTYHEAQTLIAIVFGGEDAQERLAIFKEYTELDQQDAPKTEELKELKTKEAPLLYLSKELTDLDDTEKAFKDRQYLLPDLALSVYCAFFTFGNHFSPLTKDWEEEDIINAVSLLTKIYQIDNVEYVLTRRLNKISDKKDDLYSKLYDKKKVSAHESLIKELETDALYSEAEAAHSLRNAPAMRDNIETYTAVDDWKDYLKNPRKHSTDLFILKWLQKNETKGTPVDSVYLKEHLMPSSLWALTYDVLDDVTLTVGHLKKLITIESSVSISVLSEFLSLAEKEDPLAIKFFERILNSDKSCIPKEELPIFYEYAAEKFFSSHPHLRSAPLNPDRTKIRPLIKRNKLGY